MTRAWRLVGGALLTALIAVVVAHGLLEGDAPVTRMRVWVRVDATNCALVVTSEAADALPCQEMLP